MIETTTISATINKLGFLHLRRLVPISASKPLVGYHSDDPMGYVGETLGYFLSDEVVGVQDLYSDPDVESLRCSVALRNSYDGMTILARADVVMHAMLLAAGTPGKCSFLFDERSLLPVTFTHVAGAPQSFGGSSNSLVVERKEIKWLASSARRMAMSEPVERLLRRLLTGDLEFTASWMRRVRDTGHAAADEIERLRADVVRLTREQDEALARITELKSRQPVVCTACRGSGRGLIQHVDFGWIPSGDCPNCGKDGCGSGVRWAP